ncbi:MAG TPA: F0F1 ATP synthase subunit B', partial [Sulfurovum sp.]|nr:F0F1 ATP synthase subunit B' [Sulfurovum sp.]
HIKFATKLEEERISLQNSLLSQIPLIKESLKAKFSQL